MEVQVEARSVAEFESSGVEDGERLAQSIKQHIGVTAKVSILPPSQIERSIGKAKRVIDKRPKS